MQRDCTCASIVAFLHPHISISNVVVSVTIHDDLTTWIYLDIYVYYYLFIKNIGVFLFRNVAKT